jgi:hypothetical protein
VERRSFLSLLLVAPLVPQLAKVATLEAPTLAFPEIFAGVGARLARYILPFAPLSGASSEVEAGRVATFVARSQLLFRADRLMISGEPFGFELLGVAANGEPQTEETVPAWIFAQASLGSRVAFDPTGPGQEIVLAVRNITTRALHFRASMIGRAVTPAEALPAEP